MIIIRFLYSIRRKKKLYNSYNKLLFFLPTTTIYHHQYVLLKFKLNYPRMYYNLKRKDTRVETTQLQHNLGWVSIDSFLFLSYLNALEYRMKN